MEQRLIKSIIGGLFIALGGTCSLSVDNKIIGAFLFAVGLYAICCTGQLLFTGKASYSKDIYELTSILFGNFIGAYIGGLIISFVKPNLYENAIAVCNTKLSETSLQTIILAVLCNIFIYIAVEGYKNNQPILLIMGVMAFIVCGFEHSIADMVYFGVARKFNPYDIVFLCKVVIGNLIGGQLIRITNNMRQ